MDICCLPAARCLAALCDDGSISLATYDAATLHPLPGVRSDAAIMAGDTVRAPARLAVAIRTNTATQALVKAKRRISGAGSAVDQQGHGEQGNGTLSKPSSDSDSIMSSQAAATKLLVYAMGAGPGGTSVSSGQPAHILAKVRQYLRDSLLCIYEMDFIPGSTLIRSFSQSSSILLSI